MSPIRKNSVLYGIVVALLWLSSRALGDRMQTASLGWDFPSENPLHHPNPPISDYTLLISDVRDNDYYTETPQVGI